MTSLNVPRNAGRKNSRGKKSHRKRILITLGSYCSKKIPGWLLFRNLQYLWKPLGTLKFKIAYRIACRQGDVRLHVGAGPNFIDGWLNTDISPMAPLYLNATHSFPIKNNSVLFIFSEHFIEHISREKAIGFLNESYRVLKPGGKIRISTPDVEAFAREYLNHSEYARSLMNYFNEESGQHLWNYYADIVGQLHWHDMHRYLYDREILQDMLKSAGFVDIKRCMISVSEDSDLSDIEQHMLGTPVDMFTLIMEATKPKMGNVKGIV